MKKYNEPRITEITFETLDVITLSASDNGNSFVGVWGDFKVGAVEE